MAADAEGLLYVANALGVQFCDQAGRGNGIISNPQEASLANICFGGPDFDELYATCGVESSSTRVSRIHVNESLDRD